MNETSEQTHRHNRVTNISYSWVEYPVVHYILYIYALFASIVYCTVVFIVNNLRKKAPLAYCPGGPTNRPSTMAIPVVPSSAMDRAVSTGGLDVGVADTGATA